jgi:hypothetical protein
MRAWLSIMGDRRSGFARKIRARKREPVGTSKSRAADRSFRRSRRS